MSRTAKHVDCPAPQSERAGLFIRGSVIRRSKRTIVIAGESVEVVTYGIMLEDRTCDVDEWRPQTYLDIGDEVEIAVLVRAFNSKSGRACYNLQRDNGSPGRF